MLVSLGCSLLSSNPRKWERRGRPHRPVPPVDTLVSCYYTHEAGITPTLRSTSAALKNRTPIHPSASLTRHLTQRNGQHIRTVACRWPRPQLTPHLRALSRSFHREHISGSLTARAPFLTRPQPWPIIIWTITNPAQGRSPRTNVTPLAVPAKTQGCRRNFLFV